MAGDALNGLWMPCYVALGSNLDHPIQQVQHAFGELKGIDVTRLVVASSLYESTPMGPQDQPVFINAVAGLLTQLSATELLQQLQAVERRLGRAPSVVLWGPRIIDLDLLMHDHAQLQLPELQLPHPGMLLRNFVMTPLAEIAPDLIVSKSQRALQVAQTLGAAGLRKLIDQAVV